MAPGNIIRHACTAPVPQQSTCELPYRLQRDRLHDCGLRAYFTTYGIDRTIPMSRISAR